MRVFHSITDLPKFNHAVITIGTFDGVHKGHQQIISRLHELRQQVAGESIIITFHPHPRLVINPQDASVQLLNTIEEKIALLEKYGVDNVVVVPFSRAFSEMEAEEYVADFLVKNFQPKAIVIGYDHRFGKNRSGGLELLEQLQARYHYHLEEIPKQELDAIAISSTKIRQALKDGETTSANDLLGHRYSISGVVVKGLQNGRKLGYPTANMQSTDNNKLIPRNGIYAARALVRGRWHGGLLSIGYNPTFNGTAKTVEVNILDFNEEIYGETIAVELIQYMRDEKKFDSIESLIAAMDADKLAIEAVLKNS
ncbi:MAG: bifunctional riboflavin kinase/FAD synthetase [Chitinophagales bacterium]